MVRKCVNSVRKGGNPQVRLPRGNDNGMWPLTMTRGFPGNEIGRGIAWKASKNKKAVCTGHPG